MDAAGIVDQVGEGVTTGIEVGDRVMAMVVPKAQHGAYREQLVLNQHAVVPAPANTTHLQASTLPMNALTARLSLDLLELSPGQVLAVTGGPGAYGGYVIELAKTAGLIVIADAAESDRGCWKRWVPTWSLPEGTDLQNASENSSLREWMVWRMARC